MARRIVIACWGSFGDVLPYVGLGKALLARGHRVRLALPGFYRSVVEAEGLECYPVPPDVDPNDRDLIARVMDPRRGPETIVREWVMPALRDSYRGLDEATRDADLLLTHVVTFAAPLVAQKRGLPWVSTVLAPSGFFSRYDWPVVAAAPALTPLRRLGPLFGRLMRHLVERGSYSWWAPVRELRAELGLPAGENPLLAGQFSPTLTLAMFSKVFAKPQRDWPSNVRISGFVFYNGPASLDPALEAFLDAGPPPVVFTLGTSAVGAAGDFYTESAAAATQLGVRAVLLRGPFEDNNPARPTSKHILVLEHAPHQALFPRAAAIVHHGGVGTTGQALRSGRPMLVVPYSHDQPDNADRVTRLGVGRTLFPQHYRAPNVARELDRLLTDSRYAAAGDRLSSVIREEHGADTAAGLIEEILDR